MAHNGLYTLLRSSGLGYEKPSSGCGLCAVYPAHIFAVTETPSPILYRNGKNTIYSYSRNVITTNLV
jgi:hypothetical protein